MSELTSVTSDLRSCVRWGQRQIGRLVRSQSVSERDSSARLSSYPFVSGDGLRIACDLSNRAVPAPRGEPSLGRSIWFIEASTLESPGACDLLLDQARMEGTQPSLVIHNGDVVPSGDFHQKALEVFSDVWSVNISEESDRIHALPIGLENFWWRGASELGDYISGYRSLSPDPELRLQRTTGVMASFRVATNPEVREDLERRMGRLGIANEDVSRMEYRRRLLDTKFVLSPPGNGPDCHRTWEAWCMGAVPVVLRSTLAPSLVAGTPILAVDEWDEVLGLSTRDLDDLYVSKISMPTSVCLMDHWMERLHRSRR